MRHNVIRQATPALPRLSSYLPPISFDTSTPSTTIMNSNISVAKGCDGIEISVTPIISTPRSFESRCHLNAPLSRLNEIYLTNTRREEGASPFQIDNSSDVEYITADHLQPRTPRRERTSRYLSEGDRREIITRIDHGEKQVVLAREFHVSRAAICNLYKNRWEVLTRGSRNSKAKHPKYPKKARGKDSRPRPPLTSPIHDQKSTLVPESPTVYPDMSTISIQADESSRNTDLKKPIEHLSRSAIYAHDPMSLSWSDAHVDVSLTKSTLSRQHHSSSNGRVNSPTPPRTFLVHEASSYSYPCRNLVATLRDENISTSVFQQRASRLVRLLIEEVLTCMPREKVEIKNQYGDICFATKALDEKDICGISMEDKGMVLLRAFSDISPTSPTGVVSISTNSTRNQFAGAPDSHIHAQLPSISPQQAVLLLDTQCATGEQACAVLNHLVFHRGVVPGNIYFVTVISSFEGLQTVFQSFPDVTLITAQVDTVLDQQQRIRPGIGDFMQRFWNVHSNSITASIDLANEPDESAIACFHVVNTSV